MYTCYRSSFSLIIGPFRIQLNLVKVVLMIILSKKRLTFSNKSAEHTIHIIAVSCIKCRLFNVKTKLSIYEIVIHLKLCFKDGEMVYFFIEGLILNPVECIYNLVIGGKQSF